MGAVGSAFTSMVNPQDVETVRPYVSKLGLVFESDE